VALVGFGWIALGPGSAEYSGRFTWPMMHPVHAGLFAGAALLVLAVGGRGFVRLPASIYSAMIALLTVSLVLTRTRVALAAFAVAFAVSLLLPPRSDTARRYVGIVWLVGAAVVTWALAGEAIISYLARGESTEVFTTLNGRVPLWNIAFEELADAGRWLTGFGFGSARVLLFARVEWAGTAHNAWIELLLGVGIIGCAVVAVAIVSIAARTVAAAFERSLVETRLAAAIVVFLLVASITTSALVIPGFDYSLLAIAYTVLVAVSDRALARATGVAAGVA
jgi:O-antigen ligase